jgi:hypothetical protein
MRWRGTAVGEETVQSSVAKEQAKEVERLKEEGRRLKKEIQRLRDLLISAGYPI